MAAKLSARERVIRSVATATGLDTAMFRETAHEQLDGALGDVVVEKVLQFPDQNLEEVFLQGFRESLTEEGVVPAHRIEAAVQAMREELAKKVQEARERAKNPLGKFFDALKRRLQ